MLFKKNDDKYIKKFVSLKKRVVPNFGLRQEYLGYTGYRMLPYRCLFDKDKLIRHSKKFLSEFTGDVDELNGGMFDVLILEEVNKARANLVFQSNQHKDFINRILVSSATDKRDYISIKRQLEEDLKEIESEIQDIEKNGEMKNE